MEHNTDKNAFVLNIKFLNIQLQTSNYSWCKKSITEKNQPRTTSAGTQMPSKMGRELLSSLSLLKVFLIATIFYQLNIGGYKNMCKAAPIGESSKEVKYKINPSRDFIHVENDAESKAEVDKTPKIKSTRYNTSQLFLYNLIMSDF